jgi:hypothetical protein
LVHSNIPYQRHQQQKQRQHNQKQQQEITSFDITNLQGKPFWIWDKQEHLRLADATNEQCCFNHIVGLPRKDGVEHPIYDYEKILYDSLLPIITHHSSSFKNKHLWVKKATGLGITEFMLRMMAWLCTSVDSGDHGQMCIVTGPNIDIAIGLIKRMKQIFESKLGVIFQNKETVLELNGCTIEAYPSNHIDSFRALENPKFILIDEGDFFRKSEQDDVRFVTERYIGKSDPYIVMVSTPNAPNGLFDEIEREPEESCIYKRIKLDYTYGIGKIVSKEEIDKAKKSPSFGREYDLQYLGLIGNTFHTQDIERAIELGKKYRVTNTFAQKAMGIDPGFGSSAFGIVIIQFSDGVLQVLYADEFERPRYEDMINKVSTLYHMYTNIKNIFADASSPELISSLKREVANERDNWAWVQEKMAYCKKHHLDINRHMKVVPVPFSSEGKNMLIHTKELLEFEEPIIAINPKFEKLTTSLRTAISDDLGKLDKEANSYDNVLDAFRLSLQMFKLKDKENEHFLAATVEN